MKFFTCVWKEIFRINLIDALFRELPDQENEVAIWHDGGSITRSDLRREVLLMAGALRDEGVRPGDVVVHRFRDQFLHARSCLATAALGATTYALPVGPVSLEEANNLRRIMAHWLVSDGDDPAPEGLTMITPDMNKSGPAEIMPAPDAPWLIASSSGTTGSSKLLPVTHAQQFARVGTYESWMPMAAGDVFTSLVPMDYPGGKDISPGCFMPVCRIASARARLSVWTSRARRRLSMARLPMSRH